MLSCGWTTKISILRRFQFDTSNITFGIRYLNQDILNKTLLDAKLSEVTGLLLKKTIHEGGEYYETGIWVITMKDGSYFLDTNSFFSAHSKLTIDSNLTENELGKLITKNKIDISNVKTVSFLHTHPVNGPVSTSDAKSIMDVTQELSDENDEINIDVYAVPVNYNGNLIYKWNYQEIKHGRIFTTNGGGFNLEY
jgi:hypothetical protein